MSTTWAELSAQTGIVWPSPSKDDGLPTDGIVCESVTSIIHTLHSMGLEIWKLKGVARCAIRRAETLSTMSEDEAIKWAIKQANWPKDHELSDAECGSEVHKALELEVIGAEAHTPHPEAEPFVKQWRSWLETVRPTFEAVECTVFDPTYLYAGTLDAIAVIPNVGRFLIDYKTTRNETSRGPFSDWALQLAAYRWAPMVCPFRVHVAQSDWSSRRYYLSEAELSYAQPNPGVDGAAILQITPTSWRMYPVRVDEAVRDAFYYVRGAQYFSEVIARRSVFGAYIEGAA